METLILFPFLGGWGFNPGNSFEPPMYAGKTKLQALRFIKYYYGLGWVFYDITFQYATEKDYTCQFIIPMFHNDQIKQDTIKELFTFPPSSN